MVAVRGAPGLICSQEVAYEYIDRSYRTQDSAERASLTSVARPVERSEFGRWFGVAFKGKAFVPGQHVQGQITYPGYEHLVFDILIERMEPERLLSWRWHPYAVNPKVDYSHETPTLVVFELKDADGGTLLSVVESGFDKVPATRRAEAFRMNSGGWDGQMTNVEHIAQNVVCVGPRAGVLALVRNRVALRPRARCEAQQPFLRHLATTRACALSPVLVPAARCRSRNSPRN